MGKFVGSLRLEVGFQIATLLVPLTIGGILFGNGGLLAVTLILGVIPMFYRIWRSKSQIVFLIVVVGFVSANIVVLPLFLLAHARDEYPLSSQDISSFLDGFWEIYFNENPYI